MVESLCLRPHRFFLELEVEKTFQHGVVPRWVLAHVKILAENIKVDLSNEGVNCAWEIKDFVQTSYILRWSRSCTKQCLLPTNNGYSLLNRNHFRLRNHFSWSCFRNYLRNSSITSTITKSTGRSMIWPMIRVRNGIWSKRNLRLFAGWPAR